MFSRYFADRYFGARFWPNDGADVSSPSALPLTTVIVRDAPREIIVR